jgi:homoserine kinase type II
VRAAVAVLTSVTHEEARRLVHQYGLGELDALDGIAAGSVNTNYALTIGNARYFLRIYEEQGMDGARDEAALLAHLAARGVPTPAPLAQIDGATLATLATKPAAIFPWREGGMRCQASVSRDDCARVGRALARVHRAGEGEAWNPSRFGPAQLAERLARIEADARFGGEAPWLRGKLEEWTRRRDASLPRGLIHGDLFRDNVLWNGDGEIAALLDFESASEGVFAYDLMVTAIAWCFGDALDLGLLGAMVCGYESERALTPSERAGLLAEGCAAAMRFTITRVTDYAMRVSDGPRVIKDWTRFRARLVALESLGEEGLARALAP